MRVWAMLGLLLLLGGERLATAERAEDKPRKEAGPVEVDFSPLPAKGADENYKLHLCVETADGTRFKEGYNVGAGSSVVAIRDTIKASLPEGWKVQAVGEDKLIIEGYKGSPVAKAEVRTEGLPKGAEPTVRRVPKEKKDA